MKTLDALAARRGEIRPEQNEKLLYCGLAFTEPEGRIEATKGELFPIIGRFIYGDCTG